MLLYPEVSVAQASSLFFFSLANELNSGSQHRTRPAAPSSIRSFRRGRLESRPYKDASGHVRCPMSLATPYRLTFFEEGPHAFPGVLTGTDFIAEFVQVFMLDLERVADYPPDHLLHRA